MKNLIQTILLVFLLTNIAFSQASKVFIKNLEVQTEYVVVDFPAEVSTKTSKGGTLLTVTVIANTGQPTLDGLTKSNRYNLSTEVIDGVTYIKMPKINLQVKMGTVILVENIKCEISLPENVKLKKPNSI